jgi:hypothetical protein
MLRRRIGRPGLIGTMARTAVVAGTATAVAGGVNRRQQARADDAAGQQQMEADAAAYQAQQSAPPPPPAPSAPAEDDLLTQLAKLGQMNQAGLIDDAEFAAAKAKLLGI